MSKESIETLVKQTSSSIGKLLERLTPPANRHHIHGAFSAPIKNAFSQLHSINYASNDEKDADRKALYKNLSRKFHPDKLLSTTNDFSAKLRELTQHDERLLSIPQQLIEEHKDITSQLKAAVNGLRTHRWQERYGSVTKIISILSPIFNEYLRYNAPIQQIIGYGRWLVFLALITESFYLTYQAFSSMIFIAYALEGDAVTTLQRKLLNHLTQNHYINELDKIVTTEKMVLFAHNQLKNKYKITEFGNDSIEQYLRIQMQNHPSLSRDNAFENLKNSIRNQVRGTDHLKVIYHSFSTSLMAPLPRSLCPTIKSLGMRTTQVLLFVPLSLLNILRDYASMAYFGIAVILSILSCTTAMLMLNLPLYINDGLSKTIQCINHSTFFASSDSTAENEDELFSDHTSTTSDLETGLLPNSYT